MKNLLIIALFYIKNYFLSNFVYYLVFSCYAFTAISTITFLAVKVAFKWNFKLKNYNLINLISLLLLINTIILERIEYKVLFNSNFNIVISLSVFFILVILGNVILGSIKFKKKCAGKNINKTAVKVAYEEKPKRVETISCVEEPVTVYGGYVDVSYLKSLIYALKGKELECEDFKEIEELEVYLINFVNRQPTAQERVKLSKLIGNLFKKLAKYDVA